MPRNRATEVETRSGRFVDVSNPDPNDITLDDIAWALSQTCRFGGHCSRYYSVAEHAVFVSKRMERKGFTRVEQLAGLHHDDAEAYLSDIPTPLKRVIGDAYGQMTDRMDAAVCEGLRLPFGPQAFHLPGLKEADTWALLVEARYLLPSGGRDWGVVRAWDLADQPSRIVTPDYWNEGLTSKKAYASFLARHEELTKGH